MIKWLCWKLKIGWKLAATWVGNEKQIDYWVHKKTGERRECKCLGGSSLMGEFYEDVYHPIENKNHS
jgi:hypothetical protein